MVYLAAMRAFVRSVELGSFSKAALESGQKVSTVSRHVQALEADLGAALLNRSTRRLHLTEAGREVFERASLIVADVDEARNATSALNSRPQGLLRVNLPGAFGRLHVLPAMAGFLSAHPGLRAEVVLSDERVDLIETGTDVALGVSSLPDSGLRARRIASHRRRLCAAPAFAAPQEPAGLASAPCITDPGGIERSWYFRPRPASGDASPPATVAVKGLFTTNDLQAMRQAAVDGLGIALLPQRLIAADLRDGRLIELQEGWEFSTVENFDQGVWAIYPPEKIVSPKVRAFIEHMQRHLEATLAGS